MQIEGKAAVITGGGTGVGRATALQLARGGCSVVVNYSRSQDEAEETAADIRALGVGGWAVKGDVAKDEDCRALMAHAVSELGRLDILVNSAGTTSFIPHSELDAVTDDVWDQIMGVNLKGPFQCVRAARAALQESGNGEVVNVSSIAGIAGVGSSIPYCASKAALNNMTITLARVMAPKVRVNTVAPGFITGRWLQGGLGPAYDAVKTLYEGRAPLQRVCEPDDVAAAIVSIITGSDLITGQVITVDGGLLIRDG